jgi:2,3-bisphosphoglycerate-independent phosphoglycerate mutase
MKYVIVIPDGCADDPVAELGGRTPLQAARLPNADRVARAGVVGLSNNVPPALTPASDVATLSLFGYDPLRYYTGRAPLEAAAMGVHLGPNDWAVRCNLVYAPDGRMRDFTAGHISSADGAALVRTLQHELGGREVGGGTIEFHAGVQYRNVLVWRGHAAESPLRGTTAQAPHDIPDRPLADYLPQGPGADLLVALMEASKPILAAHPVNQKRVAAGETPATQIWLWGHGQAPRVAPFAEVYGRRGAIISAVDLVRGTGSTCPAPPATWTPTTPPRAGTRSKRSGRSTWCASTSKRRTRRPTRGRRPRRCARWKRSTRTSSGRCWTRCRGTARTAF